MRRVASRSTGEYMQQLRWPSRPPSPPTHLRSASISLLQNRAHVVLDPALAKKMVSLMGAQYSKPLKADTVTHLICYKFEGEKYEFWCSNEPYLSSFLHHRAGGEEHKCAVPCRSCGNCAEEEQARRSQRRVWILAFSPGQQPAWRCWPAGAGPGGAHRVLGVMAWNIPAMRGSWPSPRAWRCWMALLVLDTLAMWSWDRSGRRDARASLGDLELGSILPERRARAWIDWRAGDVRGDGLLPESWTSVDRER